MSQPIAEPTTGTKAKPRGPRVATLLALVAICASGLAVWRFRDENGDADRAWISLNLRELRDRDPSRRRRAVEVLGQSSARDLGLVTSALVAALRDPSAEVRRASAGALALTIQIGAPQTKGNVGSQVHEASLGLLRLAKDPEAGARAEAIRALGEIDLRSRSFGMGYPVGPDPALAAPILAEALRADPYARVREEAARSLGRIATRDERAPPALLDALAGDTAPAVRSRAASALVGDWADADSVFLALVRGLGDRDRAVRAACGWALTDAKLIPDEALPDLLRALKWRDDEGRWIAQLVAVPVGRFGPSARAALPDLAELARWEVREDDRLRAVDAIIAIDPGSPEAQALVPALVEVILSSNREAPRMQAAEALGKLGPAARSALPALREARRNADSPLSPWADDLLQKIELPSTGP